MSSPYFFTFLSIIGALIVICQSGEEPVHKEFNKEAKKSIEGIRTETHPAQEPEFSLHEPNKKILPTKHRITYSRPNLEMPGKDTC